MRWLALLTLFLTLPSRAFERVDHRLLWDELRDQGEALSCHVFAATALLEAEWRGQFGESADFAEGHAFVRHFLGESETLMESTLTQLLRSAMTFGTNASTLRQAGWIQESFRLLQVTGLYREQDFPYWPLASLVQGLDAEVGRVAGRVRQGLAYDMAQDYPPLLERIRQEYQAPLRRWYRAAHPVDTEWVKTLSYESLSWPQASRIEMLQTILRELPCRPLGIEMDGELVGIQGGHSVVLVGYEPAERKFVLRNSGGRPGLSAYNRVDQVAFVAALRSVGFLRNPARGCLPQDH